ncbi:MAG: hypothetical protein AAGA68_26550 [Pseudomonadota bacterium]
MSPTTILETWSTQDFADVIALRHLKAQRVGPVGDGEPRETDCLFDLLGMEEPDDGKE